MLKDETKILSYQHFGFKSSYLETIGLSQEDMKDKKEVIEESEMDSISETLDAESNFNYDTI